MVRAPPVYRHERRHGRWHRCYGLPRESGELCTRGRRPALVLLDARHRLPLHRLQPCHFQFLRLFRLPLLLIQELATASSLLLDPRASPLPAPATGAISTQTHYRRPIRISKGGQASSPRRCDAACSASRPSVDPCSPPRSTPELRQPRQVSAAAIQAPSWASARHPQLLLGVELEALAVLVLVLLGSCRQTCSHRRSRRSRECSTTSDLLS